MKQKILVTGCAGFIGFHLCRRLLEGGEEVCGLDNLNEYYDVNLKKARLAQIKNHPAFRFTKLDLADRKGMARLFRDHQFEIVVNLAAQVGVRYSVDHPYEYIDSNLAGFANLLEGCRRSGIQHLVFASSSSVYGANTLTPFSEHQNTSHPISLYGATKTANELMAHAYAHLYGLPCTGLRFFTVYGPWGRPDMALFLFTNAILTGKPVRLFSLGKMQRDFTYIDDAVEALIRVIPRIPEPHANWDGSRPDPASGSAPWRIFNVGSNNPVDLMTLLSILESKLGIKAKVEMAPAQPGDVPATCADVDELACYADFTPRTPVQAGVERFVDWYRQYYGV
jgi:UDP-glucuronate 4-epimerase